MSALSDSLIATFHSLSERTSVDISPNHTTYCKLSLLPEVSFLRLYQSFTGTLASSWQDPHQISVEEPRFFGSLSLSPPINAWSLIVTLFVFQVSRARLSICLIASGLRGKSTMR